MLYENEIVQHPLFAAQSMQEGVRGGKAGKDR